MIDSGARLSQVARGQRPDPRQLIPRAEVVVAVRAKVLRMKVERCIVVWFFPAMS